MQQQPKIKKEISPIMNGKFKVTTLSRNTDREDYLTSNLKYIAVLPFERTADDSIKAIYGLKSDNLATDQSDTTLLIDAINPATDGTPFDAVCRSLIEEAGIDIEKMGLTEDDVFYLGNISTTIPANASFKCYAVDLTKASNPDSPIEFGRTLAKSPFTKDSSEIVKLGFHQVINGDFSDATILAGAFLLVSYFN